MKDFEGIYEAEQGKDGVINIDFGHSKQKREDKKQIKMDIGVANGVIVDVKVLSVAEYVVRGEMKARDEKILGPGKVKMTQPTLWAILEVFNIGIGVKVYFLNGKKYRCLARPLKESHKKLLECLDIGESIFSWNS